MRRKKPSAVTVTYGDRTITMQLPPGSHIGTNRFVALPTDYSKQLRERSDIPVGLRQLLDQLFERGAITYCNITFGTRMDLRLAKVDDRGRMLLSGPALRFFSQHFAEITGVRLAASWQPASGQKVRGRGSSSNLDGALRMFAGLVDAVLDGVQLAAAIKILADD